MPRYHFEILDGHLQMDPEGTELPDIAAARAEALKRAGAILSDANKRADLGEDWRIEVSDERGLLLFSIEFVVVEVPDAQSTEKLESHRG